MKWDEIESIITDKRDEFDSEIPVEAHNEKFLSKLNQYHKKEDAKKRIYFLKIAASFSILIISSIFLLWAYFQFNYKSNFQFYITKSVIEFREAQDYLANQIETGVEQLKKLPFQEPNQMNSIFEELNTMDNNNHQLQDELNSNPNDERVMNAIIDLYMVKLDAINQIIQSFSITETNQKTKDHENKI